MDTQQEAYDLETIERFRLLLLRYEKAGLLAGEQAAFQLCDPNLYRDLLILGE